MLLRGIEIIVQPMFYDALVMGKRFVSYVNKQGFCMVLRKALDII
jgi:hypothetical protein